MQDNEKLLKEYSEAERGAYLGAIASIATADHEASEDEIEYIRALAESADLSTEQEEAVIRAAKELSPTELQHCLDILKSSDLRFSLVADVISFAKSDGKYSEEEKSNIEGMGKHLNINSEQFSLLDLFVKKSTDSGKSGEEITKPGFLESLGLGDKLKGAGINTQRLSKGLLGILAPMAIASLLTGGRSRRGTGRGMMGATGAGMGRSGGGIGSLISLLSGGRGYRGMGGLLPNIFNSQGSKRIF